ncbi:MAG: tRNA threonylcarbamoyladenosine dehydratase [Lachnospiraceae bacterium]|nr:tRNA threonylcarbamoyladenosine dehydratase [Lachnospiraceae bacterium]
MKEEFSRTARLLGEEAVTCLAGKRVAVFGVGGVGGHVVEALVRSGIGSIDLIDHDTVSLSNINRQIFAVHSTVGRYKVDVARERCLDINPDAEIRAWKTFYMPETAHLFDFSGYDYVVDAIDTVTGKLEIISQAYRCKTPVISSMGTGNKLDPTRFEVADITETSVCPLAKVMRRELKRRGIEHLKVVYSRELPRTPIEYGGETGADQSETENQQTGRKKVAPGSSSFVPSVAGLIIASEVVKDLLAAGR